MSQITRRLALLGFAAVCGFGIGCMAGAVPYMLPFPIDDQALAELIPLPHHVPEHPGGISFRFAMAYDVIHERLPKHGPAHYRERDRITREQLAKLGPDDAVRLPLLDDLAVGLERLGRSDEAVEVMRDKLARQQKQGVKGLELYTTFANLGTFLIHASFKAAMAGDPEAKARFREGVEFIRESVKVNPEAHFGRERWQAAIAEFFLASMDDPKLLTTFDCLGNRLDTRLTTILDTDSSFYGRPNQSSFNREQIEGDFPAFFRPEVDLADPALWPGLHKVRSYITKVGAEGGWDAVPVPSHQSQVPFDEPVLGIIGMWREGGGANPHFSLALGETMLRVGQRYIAWAAFERAERMAERFWPDESIKKTFREHCQKRRFEIEQSLITDEVRANKSDSIRIVSPPGPGLKLDFDEQLKLGEAYQRDYQSFEEEKIKAGAPIGDEQIFGMFRVGHPSIASESGSEEFYAGVSATAKSARGTEQGLACGILGAGIAASLAACGFAFAGRLRRQIEPSLNDFGPT